MQKKFADWQRIQQTSGLNFTDSLLSKRDFHNPNMAEFLGRLGGLNEFGTNFPGYNDIIRGDDVPDFEKMSGEQRTDWERKNPSVANAHSNQQTRQHIPFVNASRTAGPTSYAALLQERRNQQR